MTRVAGIIVPIITFFSHAQDPIATTTDSAVVAAQILRIIITVIAVLAPVDDTVTAERLRRREHGRWPFAGLPDLRTCGDQRQYQKKETHIRYASCLLRITPLRGSMHVETHAPTTCSIKAVNSLHTKGRD